MGDGFDAYCRARRRLTPDQCLGRNLQRANVLPLVINKR